MGISERKEREFQRREQEILNAALGLFNGDDWQSVTIDQIARQAEIGKGTVYLHFPSKDEIYARLALDFYADMLDRLNAVPTNQPALERLRQWIGIAWRCHRRGREYHRLVTYCHRDDFRTGLSESTRDAFTRLEHDFYQPLQQLLARGMAEGELSDAPLSGLSNILRAAFEGGVNLLWHPSLRDQDPARFVAQYTDFMLAGLTHVADAGARDRGPAGVPPGTRPTGQDRS